MDSSEFFQHSPAESKKM